MPDSDKNRAGGVLPADPAATVRAAWVCPEIRDVSITFETGSNTPGPVDSSANLTGDI